MKLAPFKRHLCETLPDPVLIMQVGGRAGFVVLIDENNRRVAFVPVQEVEAPDLWQEIRWEPYLLSTT